MNEPSFSFPSAVVAFSNRVVNFESSSVWVLSGGRNCCFMDTLVEKPAAKAEDYLICCSPLMADRGDLGERETGNLSYEFADWGVGTAEGAKGGRTRRIIIVERGEFHKNSIS